MSKAKEIITRDRILQDIKALPWGEKNLLALHSSLSSLGQVEGGASSVVEALLRGIGKAGTLMVPVFTYSFSSIGKWPPFDYEKTSSVVGAISEAVRLHPQAIRSFHPTHSVAAIGPRAIDLTRAHLASSPLGVGNPFHRLAQWGGEVMLLGCDHRSNSLLHVAEIIAGLAYVDVPFSPDKNYETARIFRNNQLILDMKLYQAPGCSRGFHKAEPVLREAGVIRDGRIGQAKVQLFSASEALSVMARTLRKNPTLLLCDVPECEICPRRKRKVEV